MDRFTLMPKTPSHNIHQNINYVFASKDTQVVYLNPILQYHWAIQPIWKVQFQNELILDRFYIATISLKWKYVAETHVFV